MRSQYSGTIDPKTCVLMSSACNDQSEERAAYEMKRQRQLEHRLQEELQESTNLHAELQVSKLEHSLVKEVSILLHALFVFSINLFSDNAQ